jgi:ribosomal protein L2
MNIKLIKYKINYYYRILKIGFISNIIILPISLKTISLFYLSNGLITYIPLTVNMKMFNLVKLYTSSLNLNNYFNKLKSLNNDLIISQGFFLIKQLPINKNISLLEIYPYKGIQYVRSSGTHTKIIKINSKFNTVLVVLPSGVKKIFSIFSLGYLGSNKLTEKKFFKNNKAGFNKNNGKKSIVRGVAKNPVDHPHGGRTKTIKYPRTP